MARMAVNPYAKEVEVEIMCLAVSTAISTILTATGLGEREIFAVFERIRIDDIDEMESAIASFPKLDAVKRVGAARLGAIIKASILEIAHLAEIDPSELARTLTHKRGGTLKGIVDWLRLGSSKGSRMVVGRLASSAS